MSHTPRWSEIHTLFSQALELAPEARAALLTEAAHRDADLAAEVAALLAADERAEELLGRDALALAATVPADPPPPAPSTIGTYRVFEELGRGGSSRVWRAERLGDPLARSFALKQFVGGSSWLRDEQRARFRNEGLALSALSHPNIARVFDSGVDDAGDPYLVMELVVGEPITSHCRHHQLGLRPRLQLFLQVCDAVQHAHQRLIVHRDLKPSNVLVDGDGHCHLLDFGIAKLLDPVAAGDTVLWPATSLGLRVMTPEYAAPEQVYGTTITTTTDVYALGLLLYELVTGRRAQALTDRTLAGIERVVCTQQPIRPSLVEAADIPGPPRNAAGIAPGLLAGDVDTIVDKALRKEPEERYPSAAVLAEDVRRLLAGLPLMARPPTIGYRVAKLVARHRAATAIAVVAALGILTAAAVAVIQRNAAIAQRDVAERQSATTARVVEFLLDLFEANAPATALGRELTARDLLARGATRVESLGNEPAIQAKMREVLGRVHGQLGDYEAAETLLRQSLAAHQGSPADALESTRVQTLLAESLRRQARFAEAESILRDALAVRERILGATHVTVAESRGALGVVLKEQGQPRSAEPLLRQAHEQIVNAGPQHELTAAEIGINLGEVLHDLGRYAEAEQALARSLSVYREHLGPVSPRIADAENALANLLSRRGRYREAEPLLRSALTQRRALLGERHADVLRSLNDLGVVLEHQGDLEAAGVQFRLALDGYRELFGPDHVATAIALSNVAGNELLLGRWAEAEAHLRQSLAIHTQQLGEQNRYSPRCMVGIGVARHAAGDLRAAESWYRTALAMAEAVVGAASPLVATAKLELGRLLVESGRAAEGVDLLADAASIFASSLGADHQRTLRAEIWWRGSQIWISPNVDTTRLRHAIDAQRRLLPAGHPHLDETRSLLARLPAAPTGP